MEIAAVVLTKLSVLELDVTGRKSPPKKCLICADVGFWGVGASRSTIATTKFWVGERKLSRTENCGGPTVSSKFANDDVRIITLGVCVYRRSYRFVAVGYRHER